MYSAYTFKRFQRTKRMINNQLKLKLIILGSFLAQIVQVGVFPLFLAQLLDRINMPLSTIGWYLGAQWGVVLVLAPFVPRLTLKLGLENTNKLSGIVTIIGLFLVQQESQSFALIAACFVGTGLVLRWISSDTLVVKLSDQNSVGRTIGFHETLMGFGIAIGPLLFAWLSMTGVFYTALSIAIISMFVFMLLHNAQDEKQTEKTVNLQPCELKIIQVALLLALIGGFIETSSVSLLPFYFAVDGFSLQSSAWLVSSFGLGGTLLQLPLGFLVDKLGYSRAQLIACIVALIGLLGLFIAPIEFITLYLTVFFFGGAIGAFNTLAVIQVGSQIVSHKSASGMAYVAIFYTIGSVVGPIVISFTLDSFLSDFMLGVYAVLVITLMVVIVRQSFKRV